MINTQLPVLCDFGAIYLSSTNGPYICGFIEGKGPKEWQWDKQGRLRDFPESKQYWMRNAEETPKQNRSEASDLHTQETLRDKIALALLLKYLEGNGHSIQSGARQAYADADEVLKIREAK